MYRFNVGLMCCVAIASGIAALWGLANNDWSYQANSLVAGLFGGASVISLVYCVMLSRPGGVTVAQLGVLLAYLVSLVLAVGLGGLLGGTAWVMATDEVSFLGALVELWTLIAATGLPLLGITAGMFFYVGRKQVASTPQYRNAVK